MAIERKSLKVSMVKEFIVTVTFCHFDERGNILFVGCAQNVLIYHLEIAYIPVTDEVAYGNA